MNSVVGGLLGGRGLRRRVAEVEQEVKECRQANLRVAELTDLVAELLVPLATGDQAGVDELLERYRRSIGADLPDTPPAAPQA